MYRNLFKDLDLWLNSSNRLPLVLQGARQVGKTWLMKEFTRTRFKKVVYLNFDADEMAKEIFSTDYFIPRIIRELEAIKQVQILPQETAIIFDEIQECPRALTALKYFAEDASHYAVLAAGSLLGVTSAAKGTGFPVGKVQTLRLFPLTFCEFLRARGKETLADMLESGVISASLGRYCTSELKNYFFVGGMPQVVAEFGQSMNYLGARKIQEELLWAYEQDFAKHVSARELPRLRMIWQSIPEQLAKEQRKFVWGALRDGARAKDFEIALQWLEDAGLVHQVHTISKPDVPLTAYRQSFFKLFHLDIGLLGALGGLTPEAIVGECRIFEEFKGAMTEQFVCQQMIAQGIHPFTWSMPNGRGEVDFIFQNGAEVIPVEVKAAENLRSRSLMAFVARFHSSRAIRTSLSPARTDWLEIKNGEGNTAETIRYRFENIPLWAIENQAMKKVMQDIPSNMTEEIPNAETRTAIQEARLIAEDPTVPGHDVEEALKELKR